MGTWQRIFGSRADFEADVTVEERVVEAENRKRGKRDPEQPAPERGEAPEAQIDAARAAAKSLLDSNVISGEVVVRLTGNDGPDNQTDSVSVTVSQR